MSAIRRRVIVHGHVQGVFFRASCADKARARDVSGWVANQPDGTVEAVFEGAPSDVEAMADWIHTGPRGADVTAVDVSEESPQGISGFETR